VDINKLLTQATTQISDYLALQTQGLTDNTPSDINFTVQGINGIDNYNKLLSYLSNQPQIKQIKTSKIGVDFVVLRLTIAGDEQTLIASLQQSDNLTATDEPNKTDLNYQWSGK
jgi:hypothetical protein